MTWLRLDDKFVRHPKITRLVRGDRWTWLEVLCYCAEYKTGGLIPDTIREAVPRATAPFLERCYQAELVDLVGDEYRVHDWSVYNPKDPTGALRQSRFRNAKVTDGTVTEALPRNGESNDGSNASRVGARARPVPSPSPTPKEQEQTDPNRGLDNGPLHDPAVTDFAWDHILKTIPD